MTILLADDEPTLVMGLSKSLEHEGFTVLTAGDGAECLGVLRTRNVDLLLLDIMMPELDGVSVCRKIRERSDVPIIMLTARDDVVDRILGLEYGADDYVTKPFHTRELVARIRSVLRRSKGELRCDDVLRAGDLVLDPARRTVRRGALPVDLTAREFDLLATMMARPRLVFTREQLFEHVWQDEYVDTRAIDVHVSRIRRKIESDPARPAVLMTKRGVGYYVDDGAT